MLNYFFFAQIFTPSLGVRGLSYIRAKIVNMLKGMYEDANPMLKLFIFIGVLLFCTAIFSIGGLALAPLFFGQNAVMSMTNPDNYDQPQVIAVLQFLQIFSQIGIMILPSLLAGFLFSKNSFSFISINKSASLKYFIAVFVLMIVITPVLNLIIDLNANMHLPSALKSIEDWMKQSEEKATKLTEAFLIMNSTNDLYLNLVMVALLPAIGEEFLFRGVIQKLLTQLANNKHTAVILTAVLFSSIHLQFFGFVPRFLLGVLLGYLLIWSGSIWLPVLAHFVNNAMAVIFSWLEQRNQLPFNPDTVGTVMGDWWILLLSAGAIVALLLFIKQNKTIKVL